MFLLPTLLVTISVYLVDAVWIDVFDSKRAIVECSWTGNPCLLHHLLSPNTVPLRQIHYDDGTVVFHRNQAAKTKGPVIESVDYSDTTNCLQNERRHREFRRSKKSGNNPRIDTLMMKQHQRKMHELTATHELEIRELIFSHARGNSLSHQSHSFREHSLSIPDAETVYHLVERLTSDQSMGYLLTKRQRRGTKIDYHMADIPHLSANICFFMDIVRNIRDQSKNPIFFILYRRLLESAKVLCALPYRRTMIPKRKQNHYLKMNHNPSDSVEKPSVMLIVHYLRFSRNLEDGAVFMRVSAMADGSPFSVVFDYATPYYMRSLLTIE